MAHSGGYYRASSMFDWAAPILTMLKSDDESLQICGDFNASFQARLLSYS